MPLMSWPRSRPTHTHTATSDACLRCQQTESSRLLLYYFFTATHLYYSPKEQLPAMPVCAASRQRALDYFFTTSLLLHIFTTHPRSSYQRCLSALPADNTGPAPRCEQYVPIVKLSNEFCRKVVQGPVVNLPVVKLINEYGQ
jgi:hypothetical protein